MNPLQELKSWLLANLVLILGVVLVLIGTYAAWLHFVTVPRLELRVTAAEGNARTWEANTKTCQVANGGLAGAIDRQNLAIAALAVSGSKDKADAAKVLRELQMLFGGIRGTLDAYKPDPAKTDCQNAAAEVAGFRAERGR